MEKEIDDLKLEIDILKKRIKILENKENKRKIYFLIKTIITIILIIIIGLTVYNYYQKVIGFYNEITNLNNPIDWFK